MENYGGKKNTVKKKNPYEALDLLFLSSYDYGWDFILWLSPQSS